MGVRDYKRESGTELNDDEIDIQIRADGYVAFSALPEELLEVAAALNPTDASIARRLAILRKTLSRRADANISAKEFVNGTDEPEQGN